MAQNQGKLTPEEQFEGQITNTFINAVGNMNKGLVEAVEKNDVGGVKEIIDLVAFVESEKQDFNSASFFNAKNEHGVPVLTIAAANGYEDIVDLLLATGDVNVNYTGRGDHREPLVAAICSGHDSIVRKLLAVEDIDVNMTSKHDEYDPPIYWANFYERFDIVALLLDFDGTDLTKKYKGGYDCLFDLVRFDENADSVEKLLGMKGIDVNAELSNGTTPLMVAAGCGKAKVVEKLLAVEGIDIYKENINGETAYSEACKHERTEVIDLLVEKRWQQDHPLGAALDKLNQAGFVQSVPVPQ